MVLLNLNMIWRHLKIKKKHLKAISGSSTVMALSNYTNVNQTQTGATVPLNSLHATPRICKKRQKRGKLEHSTREDSRLFDCKTLQR